MQAFQLKLRQPAYLRLGRDGLRDRAARAVAALADCRACPRDCRVNRLEDAWAACKTGRYAVVSNTFPHFGEEDCLRGWNGSGTIFFAHCNLRCVFCQNYDISQDIKPHPSTLRQAQGRPEPSRGTRTSGRPELVEERLQRGSTPRELAELMVQLQRQGCHNINLVTPEHVVPQIVESVAEAAALGLKLPIVYNTSAYDAVESIALMDGIADIYMPDFKYWSAERSKAYLKAEDYPGAARASIRAMHEQVGPLVIGDDGLAQRGVLMRHLVMPGCLEETRAILEWIARELGSDAYVNLMDQYHPAGKVSATAYSEINRCLTSAEFRQAQQMAADLGLRRLDERRSHPRLHRRLMLASSLAQFGKALRSSGHPRISASPSPNHPVRGRESSTAR